MEREEILKAIEEKYDKLGTRICNVRGPFVECSNYLLGLYSDRRTFRFANTKNFAARRNGFYHVPPGQ